MLLLRRGENRLLGPTIGEISLAAFASDAPLPANSAALLPVLQVPADKHLQDEHLHGDEFCCAARQLRHLPEH